MKKQLLIFCIFLINYSSLFTQENYIVTCQKKKIGFYKNFGEFITNNPSIKIPMEIVETEVTYSEKAFKSNTHISFRLNLSKDTLKLIKGVWGFCDGKDVYYGPTTLNKLTNYHIFEKILSIDSNLCYFKRVVKSGGGSIGYGGVGSTPYSSSDLFEIIIDMRNSMEITLTNYDIKSLLKNDNELFEIFKNDNNSRRKLFSYLILFYNRKGISPRFSY